MRMRSEAHHLFASALISESVSKGGGQTQSKPALNASPKQSHCVRRRKVRGKHAMNSGKEGGSTSSQRQASPITSKSVFVAPLQDEEPMTGKGAKGKGAKGGKGKGRGGGNKWAPYTVKRNEDESQEDKGSHRHQQDKQAEESPIKVDGYCIQCRKGSVLMPVLEYAELLKIKEWARSRSPSRAQASQSSNPGTASNPATPDSYAKRMESP